jgi:WD40 repeat protein
LRYCGDDDPVSFFTAAFPYWREVFSEREHIEKAWIEPERRAHGFRVSAGHTRDIRAVALMPNCHRLVTGSLDKLVRVWDAHSGVCLSTLHGTSGVVSLSVASPSQIKVGYKSGLVRMADLGRLESVWEIRLVEAMRGCTFLNNRYTTFLSTPQILIILQDRDVG